MLLALSLIEPAASYSAEGSKPEWMPQCSQRGSLPGPYSSHSMPSSIFFSRPSWQTGQGVPPGGMRLVPDVSLAADPDKGAFIVLNGNVMQIGGTSWSAPVWAGFCALINEARAKANKPPLPFLNPLLYPLMGTSCFRDIKAGNNGAFDAGPGYDMITGIGVPNVKELIQALT